MKINKDKLEIAMARAQMTNKELCEKSGVHTVSFSQIRRGRRTEAERGSTIAGVSG